MRTASATDCYYDRYRLPLPLLLLLLPLLLLLRLRLRIRLLLPLLLPLLLLLLLLLLTTATDYYCHHHQDVLCYLHHCNYQPKVSKTFAACSTLASSGSKSLHACLIAEVGAATQTPRIGAEC